MVTGVLLVVALISQFRADRYMPSRYWLTVALVSVFGTLVTDNLTDTVGLPLEASTLIFSVLVALTFFVWYVSEKTLSIHSIVTRRRESFYWCAILFTFALGTATGDLMAEVLGLGYLVTGIIVASLIALTTIGWRFGLSSVLSFWMIYILTRPLGASIGDYLSQPSSQGGLDLGATVTSLVFVIGILGIVSYLSVTRADVISSATAVDTLAATGPVDIRRGPERGGLWQTVAVVALVLVAAGAGHSLRKSALQEDSSATAVQPIPGGSLTAAGAAGQPIPGGGRTAQRSPLGDLSTFRIITQDTLNRLNAADQSGATARVDDLETEWDNGEARLKPKDRAAWTTVDGKIDTVLRELRATSPNANSEKAALTALLAELG